ncbi:hypothetical protein CGLO_14219 [Colletotrichum gloeosporioides Cg-14]|uniref:Uncharacterized protein n=1 Tax=Colletotrichum gloeosporioides (strain Cg-14) TaxID=1237896 RepID=T0K4C8_COLGC|nr:hypothetical protein CGLO_14219 [Colletotrichum gloeosporioides Cg-14]
MFANDSKHEKALDGATLCSDSVKDEVTKDCQNDERKPNPRRKDNDSLLTEDVADLRRGLLVQEEPERRRRRLREREKDDKAEGGILALLFCFAGAMGVISISPASSFDSCTSPGGSPGVGRTIVLGNTNVLPTPSVDPPAGPPLESNPRLLLLVDRFHRNARPATIAAASGSPTPRPTPSPTVGDAPPPPPSLPIPPPIPPALPVAALPSAVWADTSTIEVNSAVGVDDVAAVVVSGVAFAQVYSSFKSLPSVQEFCTESVTLAC